MVSSHCILFWFKSNETDATAIAVVEEPYSLPLALATARAYLEQVTTSFSEYLCLYKASWLELQRLSTQLSSYEDRSLYTTWHLSLDKIKQRDDSATNLLNLWAHFDRQDVWYEFLRCGRRCEWLEHVTKDRANFDHTMWLLCSYRLVDAASFIHKSARSRDYSMHSCVHAWTISVINKEWDKELVKLALRCVVSMVPDKDTEKWWITKRRLLRHVANWKA
jgi:hypothetical protein